MTPLLLLAAALVGAAAEPSPAAAAGRALVVVELFTSEGCSSCPPADALLSRLGREGLPGIRVLGLSEHVDYWDRLGWRDPASSAAFTTRQEGYARRLGPGSIYTPQAVVDGAAQVLGGDAGALRQAIADAARRPRGTLLLRLLPAAHLDRGPPSAHRPPVEGRTCQWLAIEGSWPGGTAQVLWALIEDGVASEVPRGENAGRTLRHDGVVRLLAVAGSGDGSFRGSVVLPGVLAAGRHRVVAFAQATRGGRILAAGELALAPGS